VVNFTPLLLYHGGGKMTRCSLDMRKKSLGLPGRYITVTYRNPPVIPTLQPFKLLKQNPNIASTPVPIFMKPFKNIMPQGGISTATS
jgi:hypothetical protein